MRGRTYSSKNPERPTDYKKGRVELSRKVKKKEKRASLEWDDIDMQAELKSFMYIDRSLRAKKDKLIDELNFKMYAIKEITEEQVLCWDYKQTNKNIIHPNFMVDNKEITNQFIQNLKSNPKKVHNLTGEMKKSF